LSKRGSQVLDLWRQVPDLMYEQVRDPQFAVCARIVELVLLSGNQAEGLL